MEAISEISSKLREELFATGLTKEKGVQTDCKMIVTDHPHGTSEIKDLIVSD